MFALRLARELGWIDVDAMLHHMTPEQFAEWEAFYAAEYLDVERTDQEIEDTLKEAERRLGAHFGNHR